MLNNKNTNGIILAVIVLLVVFIGHLSMTYLIITGITLFLYQLIYNSFSITANYFLFAFCSAETDEKKIALTFDDGPVSGQTDEILDLLKSSDSKAGFFLVGEKIENNEVLVRRIFDEGHMIGNHSYHHKWWFPFQPSKKIANELQMTSDKIESVTGKRINLFRPPFGVTNPMVRAAVSKLNYKVIGWSIRSFDTTKRTNEEILDKIKKQVKPGAIILFHDSIPRTHDILKELIAFLDEKEYEIVRVDELLGLNI